MPSTILSSVGIQLVARWQFCRHTHSPRSMPAASSRSAFGPWPWPRDTFSKRLDMRCSSAEAQAARQSVTCSSAPARSMLQHRCF
jgi:hypothetical protein